MLRRWLIPITLAASCAVAGCMSSDAQQRDGERMPHGVYVGGSGGYGIH